MAKSSATTAPEASGYILEYTHGEAAPPEAVINGTTCVFEGLQTWCIGAQNPLILYQDSELHLLRYTHETTAPG